MFTLTVCCNLIRQKLFVYNNKILAALEENNIVVYAQISTHTSIDTSDLNLFLGTVSVKRHLMANKTDKAVHNCTLNLLGHSQFNNKKLRQPAVYFHKLVWDDIGTYLRLCVVCPWLSRSPGFSFHIRIPTVFCLHLNMKRFRVNGREESVFLCRDVKIIV